MFDYLNLIKRVEKRPAGEGCINRWYYIGDDERFIINVTTCQHNKKCKRDLMNLWVKCGFAKKFLPTSIHINTYYYTDDGNCYSWYNITHKLSDDGKRVVINFDYLMEATEENIQYLLRECIKMREFGIKSH